MYAIDYEDFGTPAPVNGETGAATDVTVEIDGRAVTVPDGTSVMRAAALAGVKVPKLCATDTLKAFGSCRLCLIEIEGRKGYPASCTTSVAAGMKIRTQSDKLMQLRRSVMELYLSDYPIEREPTAVEARTELCSMAESLGVSSARMPTAGGTWARPRTRATHTSRSTRICASSARAACGRATRRRARSPSRFRAAASSPRWRPARTSPSSSRSACPAARASKHARRRH